MVFILCTRRYFNTIMYDHKQGFTGHQIGPNRPEFFMSCQEIPGTVRSKIFDFLALVRNQPVLVRGFQIANNPCSFELKIFKISNDQKSIIYELVKRWWPNSTLEGVMNYLIDRIDRNKTFSSCIPKSRIFLIFIKILEKIKLTRD